MSTKSVCKLIAFEEAGAFFGRLRSEGKRIVQCHGTFDLVHPGHLMHLEEARSLGDTLVVTITAAEHVNKGPCRPVFDDDLRSKALSALELVDYVVLVPHPTAVEAIRLIRPNVFCKGTEYAKASQDVTGNIRDEVEAVEASGGRVEYVGSIIFSSTRLLNQSFPYIPTAVSSFCRDLAFDCPPERFRRHVEAFARLRVLVVGDIIFDRYTTVSLQGLSSKSKVVSGRFLHEQTQAGGALAVYRHIRKFTPNIKLLGLAGTEPWLDEKLREHLAPQDDAIIRVPNFTTIVKQRWVESRSNGQAISQLFAVNFIDDQEPGQAVATSILKRVNEEMESADLVLVMDFGHGVASEEVRALVQEKAKFLFVNCQANSHNYGFN